MVVSTTKIGGLEMKKWFALICIGIFLFSCLPTLAETNKTFDHRQLSKLDGYEYSASDKSWTYYASTYCMGQKSPNFFTDSHLVHIGIKASGNANEPESVDTMFSILAMNARGKLEDIDYTTFMFKVGSETITIVVDGTIGAFSPDNKEALKYLAEGKMFICDIILKNSSDYISFYPSDEEMAVIKEAAKNLYNYNIPDYISDYLKDYAKESIKLTVN